MNKSKNKKIKNSPKKKKITYQPSSEFDSVLVKKKKLPKAKAYLQKSIKTQSNAFNSSVTNNNDQINDPLSNAYWYKYK